jgi:DNA-binding NarL/FixJ family response regulator
MKMGIPSATVIDYQPIDYQPMEAYGLNQRQRDESDHRRRVLIIEDHPVYAEGLSMILETRGPYNVVGVAGNSNTALMLARQLEPQLILLDVELPGESGLNLIGTLTRICPESKVVILTGHSEEEVALQAVRLGAHGYLQKDLQSAEIVSMLDRIANGERVIGKPQILTAVLNECGKLMRDRDRDRLGVTDVEVEIIRLAAHGLNNKDIGIHQFWSEITVKRKMQDAYRKLGVKTRAQAVAEAMRLGFI